MPVTLILSKLTRTDILGAIARAWCRPETENLEMDAILADIIADEIILLLASYNIQIKRIK